MVNRLFRPLVRAIQKYRRKRHAHDVLDETFRLDREGRYADAAERFTGLAGEYTQENPLIYQLYSHDAFNEWLKAKNVDQAMRQASDVLRLLSDTGWLGKSSEAVDDLSKMVGELYVAGYQSEAAWLAEEINRQLVAHGLPARMKQAGGMAGGVLKAGQFPSVCPQCGGGLPAASGENELTCPYCGSVIRPS